MAIKQVQVGPRIASSSGSGPGGSVRGIYRFVDAVKSIDAHFDGSNHPLSEGYSSNAAAQAAYPSLTTFLSAAGLPALTTSDTTDYAAIMEAIWSLPTSGGVIILPPGSARISRGIIVGDGSRSGAASSRHGVRIYGQGNGGNGDSDPRCTTIKPAQNLGTPILTFRGRIIGVGLEDIVLDGGSSLFATVGLQCSHVIYSHFKRVDVRNVSQWGIRHEVDNTVTYSYSCLANHFDQIHLELNNFANGWMFGDCAGGYGQKGIIERNYVRGVEINGDSSSQIGLQLGLCRGCSFEHVSISGFAQNKQLVIKPGGDLLSPTTNAYPENITFYDLMCGKNVGGGDPDFFYSVDNTFAVWEPDNAPIVLESFYQEDSNPAFPSDTRFKGYTKNGVFFNGWGSGQSTSESYDHFDITTNYTIPAPSSNTNRHIVSIKQDANPTGHEVTFNAIYKFTENFVPDRRPNRRSIYEFKRVGVEYHLIGVPIVGVL